MTADNQPPGCGQSQLIGVGYVYRINNELMPHCSPFHTGATHPYNQSFILSILQGLSFDGRNRNLWYDAT